MRFLYGVLPWVLLWPGVSLAHGGVTILEAIYGSGGRYCDATAAIAHQCQGTQACSVRAGNELCGDPRRGREKRLSIHYACADGERHVEVRERDTVALRCNGRVHRGDRGHHRSRIRIDAADYGIGRRYCDAAPALSVACNGAASCNVSVGNELCGDPFRGKRKWLELGYYCGRDYRTASFAERDVARLSCR